MKKSVHKIVLKKDIVGYAKEFINEVNSEQLSIKSLSSYYGINIETIYQYFQNEEHFKIEVYQSIFMQNIFNANLQIPKHSSLSDTIKEIVYKITSSGLNNLNSYVQIFSPQKKFNLHSYNELSFISKAGTKFLVELIFQEFKRFNLSQSQLKSISGSVFTMVYGMMLSLNSTIVSVHIEKSVYIHDYIELFSKGLVQLLKEKTE